MATESGTLRAIDRIQTTLDLHCAEDRDEFRLVREQGAAVTKTLSEWSGAMQLMKWSLGLGIPAILGAVLAFVVRHW